MIRIEHIYENDLLIFGQLTDKNLITLIDAITTRAV